MAKGRKTGGRSKGTPNKVTKELRDMVLGALDDAGGQEYLTQQAKDNAPAFIGLLGRCLPKDIKLNADLKLKVSLVGVSRGTGD